MSLDNALFLVNRGGTNFKVSGSNIATKIQNNDQVLVQRGSNQFRATYGTSSWEKIGDNDLVLAWDGTNNRKVLGTNFKTLFTPIPTTCGTVRLLQTKICPDGDDEIVITYREDEDHTVVKIKGTEWLDSGMLLNGQELWLNNSKYKIFGLTENDCNGPGTEFFISGRVRGNEGQNGTPWHIHNCAAKVIAEWDWVPYDSGANIVYYYMCSDKKYYKKAGHGFGINDQNIYASKIDKSGNNVFEQLKHLDGSEDTNIMPWLEHDGGKILRSGSKPGHQYLVKFHYLSTNGTTCAFNFGIYYGRLVEDANTWIKLWDRNPRDYYVTYDGYVRPNDDYGSIEYTEDESSVTDQHMWSLDNNGKLYRNSNYYGLFIPYAVLDRQLKDEGYSELYDGSFASATWKQSSSNTFWGHRTHNGVKGLYVYNRNDTQPYWATMPIDIYNLKLKEKWV